MSASFVQHVGDITIGGTTAIGSIVIPVTNSTTLGNTLVVTITTSAGTNPVVSGVTDSKGNTYTRAVVDATDPGDTVFYCASAVALVGGTDTVTATISGGGSATNGGIGSIDELTAVDATTPLDVTPQFQQNVSSLVQNTPAITTANDSLLYTVVGYHGPISGTTSWSSPYTVATPHLSVTSASTSGQALDTAWQSAPTPGTYPAGTLTATAKHSAVAFTIAFRSSSGSVIGTATLSGSGSLSTTQEPQMIGSASLSGSGSLVAEGSVPGSASFWILVILPSGIASANGMRRIGV